MSKNSNKIDLIFKNLDEKARKTAPNIIAETATEYYKERFKVEKWRGVGWKNLNPQYAARKRRRKGRILYSSGALQASIRPETVNMHKVTISAGNSKVQYARVHNEGLRINTIQTVKPYTNKNFMGTGKSVDIKGHQRHMNFKMPKRQFMGIDNQLLRNIKRRLKIAFQK